MISIIYLIIIILTLCYVLVKKRYNYWTKRGFLQTETNFPFGSLKGVGREATYFEILDVHYKKFKGKAPVIGTYSLLSPNILLIDPEMIKNILVRDFNYFHDRAVYYNKKDDPMSANLLTLDGKEWKDRRVKLSPIFTSGKMKMMFEIIESIGNKMVSIVEQNIQEIKELDMRNLVQRFTADNIGNVAFGIDCDCLNDPNSEFMKNGRNILDYSTLDMLILLFSSEFPNVARKLGIRLTPKKSADFFHETFLKTLEYRDKNNVNRNDLVSLLLGLKDSFTPSELAAEGLLVFLAGFETSSTLMTFTLYELALNQDVQDRLREEISGGIQENDGKLTYDMHFGFKYLDMVIKEALRKYPPIADNERRCCEDYIVPGSSLVIQKGTLIEMSFISLHRDPEYFPHPETFDPERFNAENIRNIKPFTYLPFGEGPRECLGKRFGLMQSKIGIVKLIKNFKFSPCERTTIPMKFKPSSPFLAPLDDMWLRIESLNKNK